MAIRLQKYLAERSAVSRRRAEQLILAGRVAVNGKTVDTLGSKVDPLRDTVSVDDTPLPRDKGARRTIVLYKPRGYICSRSSTQGRTVYDLLPPEDRDLVCAGRLDKDSEGLVILSNDGDLVARLTHPRHGHKKTYQVTVSGNVNATLQRRLQGRMVIDGYRIKPVKVYPHPGPLPKGERRGRSPLPTGEGRERTVLVFELTEGRNRQIRKMCECVSLRIHRLVRTDVGPYSITGLKPGRWREVSDR